MCVVVLKLGEFRESPMLMSTKLKSKEISGQSNQLGMVSDDLINHLSNLVGGRDNPQPSSCPKGGEGSETRGKPKDTLEDTVRCEICGKDLYSLTGSGRSNHLKDVHKMTKEEYKKLYPDAELYSEKCVYNRRKAQKASQIRFDDMSELEKAEYFSKQSKSVWESFSEEKKKEIIRKRGAGKAKFFADNPEAAKLSTARMRSMRPDNWIEKQKKSYAKYIDSLSMEQLQEKTRKAREASFRVKSKQFSYRGIDYTLRSGLEFKFLTFLVDANIEFKYEPFKFIIDEKGHTYTPDFYIPEYNIIAEIKGKYWYTEEYEIIRREVIENKGFSYGLLLGQYMYYPNFDILKWVEGISSTSA